MRRRRSSTALAIRLGVASLVMASLALGVVAWGEERYDLAIATTMGLTALLAPTSLPRSRCASRRGRSSRATRSRTAASCS